MTYGLKVFKLGSTTKTLLDTDEDSRSMVVFSQGTVSANGNFDTEPGDVLLIKPADADFTNKYLSVAARITVTGTGQDAVTNYNFQTFSGGGGASGNLSYVVLRENNQLTAATGQEYGLQCKTTSTVVEFDSRQFNATNEFQISTLYRYGRGHGSQIRDSAKDGVYLSVTGLYQSTVSFYVRDQGYIWENVSTSTAVWAGEFINQGAQGYFIGREYGTGTANGSVRQFVERTGISGKVYTDTTKQGHFEGKFRT